MNQATNSASMLFRPVFSQATDRMLRSAETLDETLSNQRKAREAERQAFQRDTFIRSRELEALRNHQ